MKPDDPERVWAEISRADVLFLVENRREQRVIRAYQDAVPEEKPCVWDAARGQLELFAGLGVNADLARRLIRELDQKLGERDADRPGKPVHLILFAGHRVDAPGQDRRFPAARQDKARDLIRAELTELLDTAYQTVALASAAPGGDILWHEVCEECGVDSTLCLPMPADAFSRFAFRDLDDWRNRFLELQRTHGLMVLSDREGLPGWLRGSDRNPWERGNEWVLKMALAWGAERITLLVLWDGKQVGLAPGGTAHMVRLAEDTGTVRIRRIDSTQLLG